MTYCLTKPCTVLEPWQVQHWSGASQVLLLLTELFQPWPLTQLAQMWIQWPGTACAHPPVHSYPEIYLMM